MRRVIIPLLTALAMGLGAAALLREADPPAAETMAPVSAPVTPEERRYILGEYGGRVAVYSAETSAPPREITAIWVRYLPSADRDGLREGIPAADDLALAALLEDLGS